MRALAILAPLAFSLPTFGQAAQPTQPVSGYLDAFWEYPSFLPDNLPGEGALPFVFSNAKWNDVYRGPVLAARRYRPNDTICFRIVGEGYLAPRKPTMMQPAKMQFIFTKITRLKEMTSAAKCDARMSRDRH